ncbi:hypothetical protein [Aporhodopirellula aestuarii]|uniref:Uncharacterized protein n=1 Tax=Aporhodopirellula aestuarii TaxID=2950107 RepID=A0ABT0TZ49_9BACT|nr:hypothetical protein [Aporhodopirellula aestuarii]MCM2369887.1 hypothetical protein [Aporhodopirellula aestuarii]
MSSAHIDRTLNIASVLSIALFMFAPLVAVSIYIAAPGATLAEGTAEATVGVGVILRAVARRLFRAGARNVIRVTFGTMTRTVARTATTRLLRVFLRSVAGSAAKDMMDGEPKEDSQSASVSMMAIAIGVIGTALSFWGVLKFADTASVHALNSELGLSLPVLLAGAVIPLACFAVICRLAGKLFSAKTIFTTGFDGLLIQSYFTISGSFLPMTTDFEFQGKRKRCANAAILSLSIMLIIFAALRWIGIQTDNDFSIFLSAMFLTYAFVYSFPVQPLLGYSIWDRSKWMWLLMFAPILSAFLFAFPGVVAALL